MGRFGGFTVVVLGLCFGVGMAQPIILDCILPLKSQIESAPANSELLAPAGGCEWIVDSRIIVRRVGITIRGLRARVRAGVATSILHALAEGFSMYDFVLTGNVGTIDQSMRQSLVMIRASGFHVQRGMVIDSSRDGIGIIPSNPSTTDIDGGVVKDVVGIGNNRDAVSLSCTRNRRTRNVLVENITVYGPSIRGAVEVSDGTRDCIVRNIYAEGCYYGLAIQDHFAQDGNGDQANMNVTISNVVVDNSTYGILAQTNPAVAHDNIRISRVNIKGAQRAMLLRHVRRLVIDNARFSQPLRNGSAVTVLNCDGWRGRDIFVEEGVSTMAAIEVSESSNASLRSLTLGENTSFNYGVLFMMESGQTQADFALEESPLTTANIGRIEFRSSMSGLSRAQIEPTQFPQTISRILETTARQPSSQAAPVVRLNCGMNLSEQINIADPYVKLVGPSSGCYFRVNSAVITKPLTLSGVNILQANQDVVPVIVESEQVVFEGCTFIGNRPTIGVGPSTDLVLVRRGLFTMEDCRVLNSLGVGVKITPEDVDISGVTLRGITGKNNRDGIITVKSNDRTLRVAGQVTLENLTCAVGTMSQGHAVSIEDGVRSVFVEELTTFSCSTGVTTSHSGVNSVPNQLIVTDSRIVNATTGISVGGVLGAKTEVTIQDVSVSNSQRAVRMINAERAVVHSVTSSKSKEGYESQMFFRNCDDLTIRNTRFFETNRSSSAIALMNSARVKIIGTSIREGTNFLYGITFFEDVDNPVAELFRSGNNFSGAAVSALRVVPPTG